MTSIALFSLLIYVGSACAIVGSLLILYYFLKEVFSAQKTTTSATIEKR